MSLSLAPGQIVSVIGPNGAGKTTLLAAAMGLLPSHGHAALRGRRSARRSTSRRASSAACAWCPSSASCSASCTVLDNLLLGAYAKRAARRGAAGAARRGLRALPAPRRAARRSAPTRCRAASARCSRSGARSMSQPRLLMLDEPSLGLAPLIVQEILAIVRRLRDDGVSILLVEQNARAALETLRPRLRARDRRDRARRRIARAGQRPARAGHLSRRGDRRRHERCRSSPRAHAARDAAPMPPSASAMRPLAAHRRRGVAPRRGAARAAAAGAGAARGRRRRAAIASR